MDKFDFVIIQLKKDAIFQIKIYLIFLIFMRNEDEKSQALKINFGI